MKNTVHVGDRVIYACQTQSQGRVIAVNEDAIYEDAMTERPVKITEIQVEWDDGYDDTKSPWWNLADFIIARKPR